MRQSCVCLGFKYLALAAVQAKRRGLTAGRHALSRVRVYGPEDLRSPRLWICRVYCKGCWIPRTAHLVLWGHDVGYLRRTSRSETATLSSVSSLRAACFSAVKAEQSGQQHLREGQQLCLVVGRLLEPALHKVDQHICCHGTLQLGMDVVPWLPGTCAWRYSYQAIEGTLQSLQPESCRGCMYC